MFWRAEPTWTHLATYTSIILAGIISIATFGRSMSQRQLRASFWLVFLIVGMLAGEAGPGGVKFDDVRVAYLVGSIALALILFDGGLRTRLATFRSVLAPAAMLATIGVMITAGLTAPVARYLLDMSWSESLLVGAVVASTDAAAVFFLVHARGLRLRPRVGATLEVESGSNDPFAVLLTVLLVYVMDPIVSLLLPEGAVAFGLLMSAYSGGNLGGYLMAGALPRPTRGFMQVFLVALMAAFGLVIGALAFIYHTWLDFALLLLLGLGNGYVAIMLFTWMQVRTPRDMLGRAMSLFMFSNIGLVPVSQAVSGAVSKWHVNILFISAGVLVLLVMLWMAFNPDLKIVSESLASGTAGEAGTA